MIPQIHPGCYAMFPLYIKKNISAPTQPEKWVPMVLFFTLPKLWMLKIDSLLADT
jgi:hypothetical protein